MATIIAQVIGGTAKPQTASTVGEVKASMNLGDTYQASINGEPVENDTPLEDGNFVTFAAKVKGAFRL